MSGYKENRSTVDAMLANKGIEMDERTLLQMDHDKFIEQAVKILGIDKTLRSRIWRIDNLYKIKDKNFNVITFQRNRAQKDYDIERHTRNCILKARQLGFSTYKAIDALDRALFMPNTNNLIIAHTVPDAKKIYAKIEFAFKNLPSFIRDMVYLKQDSADGMEIGFDKLQNTPIKKQPGKITSTIFVASNGRSGTFSSVHITELSDLDNKDPNGAANLIAGTTPAVPESGDLDIESTARGNYGEFFDLYTKNKGKEPQSNKAFKTHFYNWQWDDEEINKVTKKQIEYILQGNGEEWGKFQEYQHKHDLTDREIACYYFFWMSLGRKWDKLRQEYPTTDEEAFRGNDEAIFSQETLDQYDTASYHERGSWKYYKMPDPTHRYSIGCDPAEGVGKDPHAIAVLDISVDPIEVVATYLNKEISPTELAYELVTVARLYNSAMVAVERNNSGHGTLGQLQQIYDHFRIYQEKTHGKSTTPQRTRRFGWLTHPSTKYKLVYDFKEAADDFKVELNDADLLEELRFFTKEVIVSRMGRATEIISQKRQNGSHADLAIATFIAFAVRDEAIALPIFNSTAGKERRAKLELRKSYR